MSYAITLTPCSCTLLVGSWIGSEGVKEFVRLTEFKLCPVLVLLLCLFLLDGWWDVFFCYCMCLGACLCLLRVDVPYSSILIVEVVAPLLLLLFFFYSFFLVSFFACLFDGKP